MARYYQQPCNGRLDRSALETRLSVILGLDHDDQQQGPRVVANGELMIDLRFSGTVWQQQGQESLNRFSPVSAEFFSHPPPYPHPPPLGREQHRGEVV